MKINIEDIILIILFIISIITGLWYLFGDSPTFEQSMIIFLMTAVFTLVITTTRIGMRVEYLEKDIKDSFDRMGEDIRLIKKKLKI